MYKIYAMDKTELPNEKDQEYNIPLKVSRYVINYVSAILSSIY